MVYPRNATDITKGIAAQDIADLPEQMRERIAQLMARASERAYRRGFQQGAHIAQNRPEDLHADLHRWRYGISTDVSPWGDCPARQSSLERLHMENPGLHAFGLKFD